MGCIPTKDVVIEDQIINDCAKDKSVTGGANDIDNGSTKEVNIRRPRNNYVDNPVDIQRNDHDRKMLRALYDYCPDSEDELSFKKDDLLYLISSQEEDWWLASIIDSDVEGYVPSNYVAIEESLHKYEWYHGHISRQDGENLLMQKSNKSGCFLIRESEKQTDGHTHTLTMKYFNADSNSFIPKNYKIKLIDGMYYITRTTGHNTLPELVKFYSEKKGGLLHILTTPCPKLQPANRDLSVRTHFNWNIDRSTIKLEVKLGSGNFGDVWKGKWNDTRDVAIKTLKEGTMKPEKFLEEANIMKKLQHNKIVALLAVCTKGDGPIYIITELMIHGSLLNYMKKGLGKMMKPQTMLYICTQIADGMSYIEKYHMIHRDLAARNILVGDRNEVKIADFGLSRQVEDDDYTPQSKNEKFPVRWTSPEALQFKQYSIKSDVWAYGIVLYEVFTYCKMPYFGMNNGQVMNFVIEGQRLSKPDKCPEAVYSKMLDCWHKDKLSRPSFSYLYEFFDSYSYSTTRLAE